jgi:hypothetical protein
MNSKRSASAAADANRAQSGATLTLWLTAAQQP